MDDVPARIFLRPIGSPLTIAMSGLAIGSFVQSGFDLSWVPKGEVHQVGLVLIAGPFVLQLIACVFAYLARDGAAGASIGVLSTTWLALGLLHLVSSPGQTSSTLGLLLLIVAGVLGLSALAVSAAKPLPGAVFMLASIRFALGGIYELSATGAWQHAAGIIGLVISGAAAYCVIAFELEGEKREPVLPTLRRRRARRAVDDGTAAQLAGIANEAGVRQTT